MILSVFGKYGSFFVKNKYLINLKRSIDYINLSCNRFKF